MQTFSTDVPFGNNGLSTTNIFNYTEWAQSALAAKLWGSHAVPSHAASGSARRRPVEVRITSGGPICGHVHPGTGRLRVWTGNITEPPI